MHIQLLPLTHVSLSTASACLSCDVLQGRVSHAVPSPLFDHVPGVSAASARYTYKPCLLPAWQYMLCAVEG